MRKPIREDLLALIVIVQLLLSGGIHLPFVEPPPFPADKLCVLVVEESTARGSYSPGQQAAMLGVDGPASIRGYVAGKKGEYLLWDKDQTPSPQTPAWVGEALKVANRDKLPWIVAATPSTGTSRELPKDAAETIAALKKIGGP